MQELSATGKYTVDAETLAKIQQSFAAGYADDADGAAEIKVRFDGDHYLCDTHTAVAFRVAETRRTDAPMVVLSTASPFKFPRDVLTALGVEAPASDFAAMAALTAGTGAEAPASLRELDKLEVRFKTVLQPADTSPELRIATRLADGIAIVKLFPGLGEEILRAMLSAPGLRAVVLETYGAGNAPTSEWFLRVLREAIDRGVILLNVTQCRGGGVSMEIYETGLRLQKIGVLSGYDMTTEAAVTKLMYVLGLGLDETRTRELLRRPLRGEFTL